MVLQRYLKNYAPTGLCYKLISELSPLPPLQLKYTHSQNGHQEKLLVLAIVTYSSCVAADLWVNF